MTFALSVRCYGTGTSRRTATTAGNNGMVLARDSVFALIPCMEDSRDSGALDPCTGEARDSGVALGSAAWTSRGFSP